LADVVAAGFSAHGAARAAFSLAALCPLRSDSRCALCIAANSRDVIPLVVWFAPLPLEPVTKHGFAIVGFMVVAWITRAMDYS
jgi:hypothetical protein